MKHVVVVRSNFQDDTLFDKYLTVAKETFFPSINSQINKNFTIFFTVNPNHKKIIKELIDPKIRIVFFNNMVEVQTHLKGDFYEIQTRHDFDDWMKRDYISRIQYEWSIFKSKNPNIKKILIQSQPTLFLLEKRINKPMRTRYSNKFVSMHLSLCQNKNENFIYEHTHPKMNKITSNVKLLPYGFTRLVIHKNNKLSNKNS